jgi:UDP-N-acetylglucosamine--dolichyl-phosphate N-acetylglucosaminephosphotransferase
VLHVSDSVYEQHLLSAALLIPFVWVSLALFKFNKYPSEVFIGDTYCYFAGMTLAVAGILGHYSKTLLLFFIPQILNFLISFPQLVGIVKCPRHRLPKFNATTGNLEGVKEHWTLINVALHVRLM